MRRIFIISGLFLGLLTAGRLYGQAAGSEAAGCQVKAQDSNQVEAVLADLQRKANELKSYQAKIDYVFKQPLLESQQRRKGILSYARFDNKSYLRIDFQTLQQDEEPEQKRMEQFFFDGVWLCIVDHKLKTVQRRQLTEPNEPVDALALASRHVPVLGFSNVEDLRRQFDVQLVAEPQAQAAAVHHLYLKVKPDSVYKDDYTTIDFWIDRKVGLPGRIVALTTEEDIYEIKLIEPKVNTALERGTFQVNIPRGFAEEVVPLEEHRSKE